MNELKSFSVTQKIALAASLAIYLAITISILLKPDFYQYSIHYKYRINQGKHLFDQQLLESFSSNKKVLGYIEKQIQEPNTHNKQLSVLVERIENFDITRPRLVHTEYGGIYSLNHLTIEEIKFWNEYFLYVARNFEKEILANLIHRLNLIENINKTTSSDIGELLAEKVELQMAIHHITKEGHLIEYWNNNLFQKSYQWKFLRLFVVFMSWVSFAAVIILIPRLFKKA